MWKLYRGRAMRMRLNAPLGPAGWSSHGNGIWGREGANPLLGITTADGPSWQASASSAARADGKSRPQATGCRRRPATRYGRRSSEGDHCWPFVCGGRGEDGLRAPNAQGETNDDGMEIWKPEMGVGCKVRGRPGRRFDRARLGPRDPPVLTRQIRMRR